jgi:DNA-binding transcriptional ArsR family regulator
MQQRDLTQIFSSLAGETRIRLLQALKTKALGCADLDNCDLSDRCCNVTELAEAVGLAVSTTSYHIRELRLAGLIQTQRQGKLIYCSIDTDTTEQLAQFFRSFAQVAQN